MGGPASDAASAEVSSSFAAFYETEIVGQVRSATLILGSQHLAQDVVHDVFVATFQAWDDIDDPGPYLQRSVVNACRDALRRRSVADRFRRRHVPAVEVNEVDVSLFDALLKLPFNHRAAVVLRFYLQLTEAEIAEHLDCPQGSVGPWIRRGLDRLNADLYPTKEQ